MNPAPQQRSAAVQIVRPPAESSIEAEGQGQGQGKKGVFLLTHDFARRCFGEARAGNAGNRVVADGRWDTEALSECIDLWVSSPYGPRLVLADV
jgi:hypothetical protein